MDHDGDGVLSQEELRKSGSRFTNKEIEALFAVGDINGDGELDINEFINVICPGATTVISRIRFRKTTNHLVRSSFQKCVPIFVLGNCIDNLKEIF